MNLSERKDNFGILWIFLIRNIYVFIVFNSIVIKRLIYVCSFLLKFCISDEIMIIKFFIVGYDYI